MGTIMGAHTSTQAHTGTQALSPAPSPVTINILHRDDATREALPDTLTLPRSSDKIGLSLCTTLLVGPACFVELQFGGVTLDMEGTWDEEGIQDGATISVRFEEWQPQHDANTDIADPVYLRHNMGVILTFISDASTLNTTDAPCLAIHRTNQHHHTTPESIDAANRVTQGLIAIASLANQHGKAVTSCVAQAEGFAHIISAMRTFPHSASVQRTGCLALASLTSDSTDEVKRAIVHAGAGGCIKRTLQIHMNDGCILYEVWKVMRVLANHRGNCRPATDIFIRDLSASVTVLRAHISDVALLTEACWSIAALASRVNTTQIRSLLTPAVIEFIATAATTHQGDSELQAAVCTTIGILTTLGDHAKLGKDHRREVPQLARVLFTCLGTNLQDHAVAGIYWLCWCYQKDLFDRTQRGTTLAICAVMSGMALDPTDGALQLHGIHTLVNLLQQDDTLDWACKSQQDVQCWLQNGPVRSVTDAVENHADDEEIQRCGSRALGIFSGLLAARSVLGESGESQTQSREETSVSSEGVSEAEDGTVTEEGVSGEEDTCSREVRVMAPVAFHRVDSVTRGCPNCGCEHGPGSVVCVGCGVSMEGFYSTVVDEAAALDM